MAVAQLYHHCAPKSEVGVVARSLVRLLRSHKYVNHLSFYAALQWESSVAY